ncbi:MAG: hypothetical protein PHR16_14705 [Methylovulum sp.]|nr:hypothetical protein [Methylovulum sp.]
MRVFSLLALDGPISPYLSSLGGEFTRRGFDVQIKKRCLRISRGGNQMLVIKPE